ncbi:phospholipid scramblase 2-like [Liolophura sinensis]|uniref:phospholipid scramblase 2-like n=1 Tax=Liolophura sinensis TaxID=3198878 RepID=UPI00315928D5
MAMPVMQQPGSKLHEAQAMPMQGMNPALANLPPGLQYLAGLDEIVVHQIFEALEVVVGWERNNRYNICNNQEQQVFFAKEDTDCCTRQFLGVIRPFEMMITDNQGQQLIKLDRPCRCQGSCCWCCYLQEMDIQSPPGVVVGKIEEIWTCVTPKYVIKDGTGQVIFNILGDCCYCKCCTDVVFKIFEGETQNNQIGEIIKHWGGCREIFGGVNDFRLKMPQNLDIMKKIILLGSLFLVDFMYFEHNKN